MKVSDLISRLRCHNDERLYLEADLLMAEAAGELERMAGITHLEAINDGLITENERLRKDAERYLWLCSNNFDREGATQVHTWLRTWKPHTKTGEAVEWTRRIRGGALDAVIDAAIAGEKT